MELVSAAYQVARGMAYLASKKVRSHVWFCRSWSFSITDACCKVTCTFFWLCSVSTETWQPGTCWWRKIMWWRSLTSVWPGMSTTSTTTRRPQMWNISYENDYKFQTWTRACCWSDWRFHVCAGSSACEVDGTRSFIWPHLHPPEWCVRVQHWCTVLLWFPTNLRMLMMSQMVVWGLAVGDLYPRWVPVPRSPRGGTVQAAKRGASHGKTPHLHSGIVSQSTRSHF